MQGDLRETLVWCAEHDSSNHGHDNPIDYVEDDTFANDDAVANNVSVVANNDSIANNDCTTCTRDDNTRSNKYDTACYQHTSDDNKTRCQVRFKLQGWPIENYTGM